MGTMNRRKFLVTSLLAGVGGAVACSPLSGSGNGSGASPVPFHTPPPADLEYQVLLEGLDFPEGPAFTPAGELWCTELAGGNLVRIAGGKGERVATGGRPNGLTIDQEGLLWVCDSGLNAIRSYDPEADKWETIADAVDGEALQSPNDLCFDKAGNLLFTCPNFANTSASGYVACLSPAGEVTKISSGLHRPNGLALSPDGSELVVADTFQKVLLRGSWDAAARLWKDPLPWAQAGGSEGPDGMAWGKDGNLYQAIYGDGVVRVFLDSGELAYELKLPGTNATNAAIDPSGKLGLVVTETQKGQILSFPRIQPGEALFR